MIGICGFRGTGKTTLLWQLAEHLHRNHTNNVYYFNVTTLKNLGVSLYQALIQFQNEVLPKKFVEYTEPIALLFDNVDDDEQWVKTLNSLSVHLKTGLIVVTSNSTAFQNVTEPNDRIRIEKIQPFRFAEFVQIKTYFANAQSKTGIHPPRGLSMDLKKALFFSESGEKAFGKLQYTTKLVEDYFQFIKDYLKNSDSNLNNLTNEYVNYHNIPSTLFIKNKTAISDSIIELLRQIIFEDLQKIEQNVFFIFNVEKLLLKIANLDEIQMSSLSQMTDIPEDEIQEILQVLVKAELIHIVKANTPAENGEEETIKIYFISPSFRRSLLSLVYGDNITIENRTKIFEDLVAMYLKRISPDSSLTWLKQTEGKNPVFVLQTFEKPIFFEIGINKSNTMRIENKEYRYGVFVNTQITDIEYDNNIIHLPLNYFLLL